MTDPPAVATSAAHLVAARLRAEIQERGLVVGDRLGSEAELAIRLGTSRIVLREALRMLAAGHLIRANRGRNGGIFVANTFTAGLGQLVTESAAELLDSGVLDAPDLIEARIAIEVPLAGAVALTADPTLVEALGSLVEIAELGVEDRAVVESAGAAFHRLIAQAGGNPLLSGITAWIFDLLEPELHRLQGRSRDDRFVVEAHRAIAVAIRAGDRVAAEDAMRDHLVDLARRAHLTVSAACIPSLRSQKI